MKRAIALGLMLLFVASGPLALADEKADQVKEALQALQDYIGEWNSAGSSVGFSTPVKGIWKEKIEWGWKFKGEDAWLTLAFTDSKLFKGGDLRYDPAGKKYVLNLVGLDGKSRTFSGDIKKDSLVLEHRDVESKEIQKLSMNTAAEGIRFLYYLDRKPEGGTIWSKLYKGEATRAGQSLGKEAKKNQCIVSGGLGTIGVSAMGRNFFVCCSGCRDAFNENPEKYIKEWDAKKKKQ